MTEIAPDILEGLGLRGEPITFVHGGRSADLYRVGAFALKLFRNSLPRARNEYHALLFLNGRFAIPRAHRFYKNDMYAALASEWLPHRVTLSEIVATPDATISFIGETLAQIHELDPNSAEVKYSTDPLPLPERLISVAETIVARSTNLAEGGLKWLGEQAHRIGSERCFLHRDLTAHNIAVAESGPVFIDWEDAALGPAAWDFVKLGRWLTPGQRARFDSTYGSIRSLPDKDEIEYFEMFESLTEWGAASKGLSDREMASHRKRVKEILER